jgi:hypothetical protein
MRAVMTGLAVAALALGVTSLAGGRSMSEPVAQPMIRPTAKVGATQGTPITALAVSVATPPRSLPGSDGRTHIAYDLLSTNSTPVTITLTGVEVMTTDGRSLASLTGDALVAATHPVGSMNSPSAVLPTSGTSATMVDVVVPDGAPLKTITHRITYSVPTELPPAFRALLGDLREVQGPELTMDSSPPIVIAAPVAGPGWASTNGCCAVPTSQHRISLLPANGEWKKPELFGIDYVQVQNGELCSGDCTTLADFPYFGSPLYAVGNGVVVAASDGRVDHPTTTPPPPTTAIDFTGNHVVIELRPGVYAYYAHLARGSVAVAVGDRVKTGQQIGRLGNSGNSFGPHLHFSLLDVPDYFQANSIPYVIDRFTLEGTADLSSAKVVVVGPARDVRRVHPLIYSVGSYTVPTG